MKTRAVELNPYPTGESVGIAKMSITYVQQPDGNDVSNEAGEQTITISTEDIPTDGMFPYYFTLKSDRWAFDSVEELASLVEDFMQRIGAEMSNNKTE